MNGNISQDGIKLDLEWMHRVGIAGFQNFDAALQTPQVVEKRLAYMTPEWKEAFRFAISTGDKLGMEMAIAGSPGWSESGGPWVPPSHGMKKYVWSETILEGGKQFTGKLAHPPTTTGAFQTTNGGGGVDAFVTKLNATGSGLVYSTYLGGTGQNWGNGIAVDSAGNAYVTGLTSSTGFPVTSGAFGTASGGWDAFVTKLNTVGGALVYSTYLGGSNNIWGYAIALDPSGSAYVAGTTDSADFPTTPGAFQTAVGVNNNFNAFVAKIGGVVADPDLAIRLWGAPRTGSRSHLHYAITVENNGPDDASSVTVIDTLPNGTTFVSATPTQGVCTTPAVGGAGTVTCNLGAVTAGGKVSIRLAVHVTAPRGSAISNTATVSGNVSDTNTANNSSTATTSVM